MYGCIYVCISIHVFVCFWLSVCALVHKHRCILVSKDTATEWDAADEVNKSRPVPGATETICVDGVTAVFREDLAR